MQLELYTERLHLRPINLADAEFVLALVNSPGWLQFIGDRNIRSIQDAEQYIQKILDHDGYFYNVFALKATGQPLGLVTFLHRDTYDFPDIGFALLPEFAKQGYALEACQAYLHALKQTGLYTRIIGITLPDNRASIALLERLGFVYEYTDQHSAESLLVYGLGE